ncbi:hypothetical protein DCCM_3000 [Desulfocucumis palustris]|uniref:Uncharacterized protein n=1 Tax=Desulfocucumis palustris TaxID=1898651 RepID=A0A2L2XC37_9FIRM|nr:hypothetical protein DCCM_3000 [Desulfocucumis palustris]
MEKSYCFHCRRRQWKQGIFSSVCGGPGCRRREVRHRIVYITMPLRKIKEGNLFIKKR